MKKKVQNSGSGTNKVKRRRKPFSYERSEDSRGKDFVCDKSNYFKDDFVFVHCFEIGRFLFFKTNRNTMTFLHFYNIWLVGGKDDYVFQAH